MAGHVHEAGKLVSPAALAIGERKADSGWDEYGLFKHKQVHRIVRRSSRVGMGGGKRVLLHRRRRGSGATDAQASTTGPASARGGPRSTARSRPFAGNRRH